MLWSEHTKTCQAEAIICAVENVRDQPGARMEGRDYAEMAAGYLADGTKTCEC